MKKYAIGIMSGTSLDGIDISLVEIDGVKRNTNVREVFSKTFSYSTKVIEKIKIALDLDQSNSQVICTLNNDLAVLYSECIFNLLEDCNFDISNVDFIASHGQTIYHIAPTESSMGSSLQLGDGSVLAYLTNTTVVSNFRQADIACGGEGAPLVPYADYILFTSGTKTRCMQNIGGISNVTVLPSGSQLDQVYAFDNGPGNMMIDYAMEQLYSKKYDEDGRIAKQGSLIQEFFDEVVNQSFFKEEPPKSTGRELFGKEYTDSLLNKYSNNKSEDIISTFTHITAYTIAESYKDFVFNKHLVDEVIVSGGGSHNSTLLELISTYLDGTKVNVLEKYGFDSDYKEAIAFVILANETLNMNPSNVPSATGAKRNAVLGQISYINK